MAIGQSRLTNKVEPFEPYRLMNGHYLAMAQSYNLVCYVLLSHLISIPYNCLIMS